MYAHNNYYDRNNLLRSVKVGKHVLIYPEIEKNLQLFPTLYPSSPPPPPSLSPLTLGLWFCRCELFCLQCSLGVYDRLSGHMINRWFIDVFLASRCGWLGCGRWLHLLWNTVLLQIGRCVRRVCMSQKEYKISDISQLYTVCTYERFIHSVITIQADMLVTLKS